jgi:hypothetical protein
MRKRVYIETSIPSFLVETRTDPEMISRRNWTREWWEEQRSHYELATSLAVMDELEEWDHPHKGKALELISGLSLLPVLEPIYAIVEAYIERHVLPRDPQGDALHLALASYHHCHFLLTWNCRHLANANKFEHIRHVNSELGLFCPILTTPFELLEFSGGEIT